MPLLVGACRHALLGWHNVVLQWSAACSGRVVGRVCSTGHFWDLPHSCCRQASIAPLYSSHANASYTYGDGGGYYVQMTAIDRFIHVYAVFGGVM